MSNNDGENSPPSPVSHQEKEGSDTNDTNDIENGKQSKPEEGPTPQPVHITDGGAKAWSTVVGGYVHSTESQVDRDVAQVAFHWQVDYLLL